MLIAHWRFRVNTSLKIIFSYGLVLLQKRDGVAKIHIYH